MSNIALQVESLGKQYRIARTRPHDTLRDVVSFGLRQALTRSKPDGPTTEMVWALKDVSFEVKPGEIVGIIGRNGAGKSTLLKLLSRITEPTTGRAEIFGRVGSLLEVGTGFHPELTGRDNIYLSGAILGLKKREIDQHFDAIVAFAEVERYLDTPVKRYSSGMHLRLGFAVAAHLQPEILVVDEVLAVGDARFQRKCLDKMQDVGESGRTVLFVSHNLSAVAALCPRTLLIEGGRLVYDGATQAGIDRYTGAADGTVGERSWSATEGEPGDDLVRLHSARLVDEAGRPLTGSMPIDQPLGIRLVYQVLRSGSRLTPGIICSNGAGTCLFSSADLAESAVMGQDLTHIGRRQATCWIPGNYLAEGRVFVDVAVYSILEGPKAHILERAALVLDVVESFSGATARGVYTGPVAGVVRPKLNWVTELEAAQ